MNVVQAPRSASERLVAASARALTRRRLIGNVGSTALGAAMVTAFVGRAELAEAQCASASPCGPAPMCGCSRCNNGYDWQCDGGEPETTPARWGSGSQPCSPSYGNCWPAGSINCCDCCAKNPTCTSGARCTSCGSGSWYKCICRQGVC